MRDAEASYLCASGDILSATKTVSRVAGEDAGWLAIHAEPLDSRHATEDDLAHATSRLRATLEATADGILLVDRAGGIVNMNQRFSRMWGLPEELLIEHDDSKIFGLMAARVVDQDAYRARLTATPPDGDNETFDILHLADGRIFERISMPARHANQIFGRVFSFTDITERARAADALRESDLRYRDLFQVNPHPMWVCDAQTLRILMVNDAALAHYGYGEDEFLAMTIGDICPSEDLPKLRKLFAVPAAQGTNGAGTCRHRKRDGTLIDVEISSRALKFGEPRAIVVLAHDITERKRHQDEVLRLNNELERRVQERTRALEMANRELESFAYSVSHDLRTPLRAINGFSRLIEEDHAGNMEEQGRALLQRVGAAARRMGELIEDLLKLSRISRQEIRIGPIDLSALARAVVEELQAAEPGRQADWVIASGVQAAGDAGLLRVTLQNLIGNAWKYSSNRDITRIEFGVVEKDGRPVYFVRDNGAGFDMAYSERLFGAFQRLHSPEEFPGTGIGLATVARIVHRHGGEVWAEGKVNEGATFYFSLG